MDVLMADKERGDGQEELAVLDTLEDDEIDASLDGWLRQFALAPHLPTSPSPHDMAVGQGETT